jgi:flavin-dependent dehydrogenase
VTSGPDLEVLDPTGRAHLVLGTESPQDEPPPRREPGKSPVPARSADAWDVVVVGGGPAGSVAAGTLAARGRRVLLVESSAHPTARVGESLSPTCLEIIDRLGAGAAVRGLGSVPKTGATFLWGDSDLPWSVRYQPPGAPAAALHVRRPEFDETLRRAAEALGAEVRRGSTVQEVLFEDERACGVRLADGDAVRSRWVVDASGPATVLGRQLRLLTARPGRTGTAVWSYWTGADRLPDAAAHDSLYVGGADRCWWYLPVGDDPDLVAVGMWGRQGPPSPTWRDRDRWYEDRISATSVLSGLLAGARREWPVRSTPADPYAASELAGPGWLIAGDAGGFVDPVLTPGVQLACEHGVSAARVLDTLLSDGTGEAAALAFYDVVCRRPLDTFTELCGHLYAAGAARDHGCSRPKVLEYAAAAGNDSGRTTFLATISGLTPERLPAALGVHLGRRGKAAERGGVPPQFGETEGFAFLSRVVHERRLAAATGSTDHEGGGVVLAPGVEIGDHVFFDPDPDRGLIFAPAVSNRFGDRFRLTPELRAILTGSATGSTTSAEWLDLLVANGLIRGSSPRTASALTREADGTCVR